MGEDETIDFAEMVGITINALLEHDVIGVELHLATGRSRSAKRFYLTRPQALDLVNGLLGQVQLLQAAKEMPSDTTAH